MAKKNTGQQKKQNVKLLIAKHYNITSLISKVVTTLIKTGGFVLIALFALQAIRILAGQTTMATIGINFSFLANLKIPEALGVIFGIGGVSYGAAQDLYRRQKVKQLTKRILEVESFIDPDRSSSGLTLTGNTRREDK